LYYFSFEICLALLLSLVVPAHVLFLKETKSEDEDVVVFFVLVFV